MGKSTAAKLLIEMGVQVVDSDLIARQVVEPGQPALAEVAEAFGKRMIAPDGTLLRHDLAVAVFCEAEARLRLERILHPRIREVWLAQVESWRAEHRPCGVVIIPLLFETNAAAHFDATICLGCSLATQQQRLETRGWSLQEIDQRRRAQWGLEKKMFLSDYVVWSEGSLAVHKEQLQRIVQR